MLFIIIRNIFTLTFIACCFYYLYIFLFRKITDFSAFTNGEDIWKNPEMYFDNEVCTYIHIPAYIAVVSWFAAALVQLLLI
ncbi:MAG: hypothetical protein WBE75_07035 [Candidatus Omnitrophota bacterium]|jgi:hypothetical protein